MWSGRVGQVLGALLKHTTLRFIIFRKLHMPTQLKQLDMLINNHNLNTTNITPGVGGQEDMLH